MQVSAGCPVPFIGHAWLFRFHQQPQPIQLQMCRNMMCKSLALMVRGEEMGVEHDRPASEASSAGVSSSAGSSSLLDSTASGMLPPAAWFQSSQAAPSRSLPHQRLSATCRLTRYATAFADPLPMLSLGILSQLVSINDPGQCCRQGRRILSAVRQPKQSISVTIKQTEAAQLLDWQSRGDNQADSIKITAGRLDYKCHELTLLWPVGIMGSSCMKACVLFTLTVLELEGSSPELADQAVKY